VTASSPPVSPPAAEAAQAASAAARAGVAAPPGWQVWAALWIVYLVWGSTYLAIRVMVETLPPLLGAGTRFVLAGGLMLLFLTIRRGRASVRLDRRTLLGAALVGILLPGANAVVTVAEQHVPSGLAALLIGSIPLWVIVLRVGARDRVAPRSALAVLLGFVGVGLLVRPGPQSGDATIVGLLTCVAAAAMWATGSFASSRVRLPRDVLASVAWQMFLGGIACAIAGFAAGEAGDVHPGAFSVRSIVALAYLIAIGSWLAYTAYAWLLQNAPLSKVSTYAYVNPVVAIVLGWLVLGEVITGLTVVGAAIVVASVALVVRAER
jgi:drug/metabolite transporter (DMT)-like permease